MIYMIILAALIVVSVMGLTIVLNRVYKYFGTWLFLVVGIVFAILAMVSAELGPALFSSIAACILVGTTSGSIIWALTDISHQYRRFSE